MQSNRIPTPLQRRIRLLLLSFPLILLLALAVSGAAAQAESPAAAPGSNIGKVFVMTNDAAGNAVQAFSRADDGSLSPAGTYPTGGLGSGSGLGSQGALILSHNNRYLFVVNAGSNEISSFRVRGDELVWADTVSSNGEKPISLTFDGRRLYVLNAGGSGNVTGFKVQPNGALVPIPGATQYLSNNGVGAAPGPAQVSFTPNGRQLVVSEKGSNQLVTYNVTSDGLEPGVAHASNGQTPFGFDFARGLRRRGRRQRRLVLSRRPGHARHHHRVGPHRADGRLLGGRHRQRPLRLHHQHWQRLRIRLRHRPRRQPDPAGRRRPHRPHRRRQFAHRRRPERPQQLPLCPQCGHSQHQRFRRAARRQPDPPG